MIGAVRDVKETKRRRNRMRSKGGGREGWGGRRSGRVEIHRITGKCTMARKLSPIYCYPFSDSEQACRSFPGPQGWDESLVHRASCLFVFAFLLAIFPLQSFGYVVRDFSCYCTNFRSLLFPSILLLWYLICSFCFVLICFVFYTALYLQPHPRYCQLIFVQSSSIIPSDSVCHI